MYKKIYDNLHLRLRRGEKATFAALAEAVIGDDMAGQRGATVTPLIRRLCEAFLARPIETAVLLKQAVAIGKKGEGT